MCVFIPEMGIIEVEMERRFFFPLLVFPRVNETTLRYTGRHKKVEGARSVPDVIWTVSSVPVVIPEFPLCNKKLYISFFLNPVASSSSDGSH